MRKTTWRTPTAPIAGGSIRPAAPASAAAQEKPALESLDTRQTFAQADRRPVTVLFADLSGFTTLSDVLDLEREDVEKVAGMSPELTDQMMSFLAELIGEDASDEEAPSA